MKPNPNLDELLSSFMDGELSPRQRTEVQRMAAHDPQVARRLRQLQNCRLLYCSLPAVQAPADTLEQIKMSLERQTLLQKQPSVVRRRAGAWNLAFRRFVAAAAVIALLGVLGFVVYQILAPVPPTDVPYTALESRPSPEAPGRTVPSVVAVADAGFTGRLELRTARVVQADAEIQRAIGASGLSYLSDPAQAEAGAGRHVYQVVGTRENVYNFVASLSSVWQNFHGTRLQVDRLDTPASVIIEAVTAEQAANVIAERSTEASIETAQRYAVMNHMTRNMPGGEIVPLIQEDLAIVSIPMPKMTGPEDAAPAAPALPEEADVTLTIVLLDAK